MAVSCDGGKKLGFGLVSHVQEGGGGPNWASIRCTGKDAVGGRWA